MHLQVEMQSQIYDVAVDIGQTPDDQIYTYTLDTALPDGAWMEGWHPSDALDYSSLGVTATMFVEQEATDAATAVENALAEVNHISVFGTGYSGQGMHLVHYESHADGAIVVRPTTGTPPQLLLFRFGSDTW